MSKRVAVLIAAAILAALAFVVPAQARARYPYTLIDPGTFGGPESFLNEPGFPLTAQGTLLGTADTSIPDADYPNFNPFVVGFPDPYVAHAFVWQRGQLHDLGALAGNNSSAVFQVNGNGVGVGMSETAITDPFTGWPAEHAVMFKHGRVIDLGTLPGGYESQAQAITDTGEVSGFASNGIPDPYASAFFGQGTAWDTQVRTFVWQDGVMRDIGTLGGPDTLWNAANDFGEITGASFTNSTPDPANGGYPTLAPFLWRHGQMIDLGTFGGTFGMANAINDTGEVVGVSDLAGDDNARPFLWKDGHLIDLGSLGGGYSAASAINEQGDVAGSYFTDQQNFDGFLWRHGKLIDLPPVGGAAEAFANTVNGRDQVVGSGDDDNFDEVIAVLWSDGHGYDLNTLVAPSSLQMTSADYINDRGDIVGHGVLTSGPNSGAQRIFLLIRNPSVPLSGTPTPATRVPATGQPDARATDLRALHTADRANVAAATRALQPAYVRRGTAP